MELRLYNFSSKSMILRLGLVLLWGATCGDGLKLAMIAGGSSFFEAIIAGFKSQCQHLGAECDYVSTLSCGPGLDEIVVDWISQGVKGIAWKPCTQTFDYLINSSRSKGVHVTTFDADSPMTLRDAYVGTDNFFLGRILAKLVRQLRPEGGTFVFIGRKSERDDGFISEITRYNDREDRAHWYELEGPTQQYLMPDPSNLDPYNSPPDDDYLPLMERAAVLNPTVMLFLKQTPMKHANYTAFIDKHGHRNITYIGVDGADYQLAYLNSRYVDGLVGQLPFEIGLESANLLYDLIQSNGTGSVYKVETEKQMLTTNSVAFNIIPSRPPTLDIDENLIGNLKYMGYVCFGIVSISVIACVWWTWRLRLCFIVRTSQPRFLYMVATGVLIMAGSMIPLTFDDGGSMTALSHTKSVAICMTVPWLALTGFTVVFSGLAAKLWRVNRLFHPSVRHARIQVTELDVLAPVVVLLVSNIILLTLWTALDPLKYQRGEDVGVDYWNRVISTYGACRSENVVPYLVPLGLIDGCAVLFACWQAIQARHISSEFSEAQYVGLAMGVLLQAFLTGFPVLFMVRDDPKAYYIVLTMVMFVASEGILLLIFVPKVIMQRKYGWMSEDQQIRAIRRLVRQEGDAARNASSAIDASSSAKLSSDARFQSQQNSSQFARKSATKDAPEGAIPSGVSDLLASAEGIILDEIIEGDEGCDEEAEGESLVRARRPIDDIAPEVHSGEEYGDQPVPITCAIVRNDQESPSEITQDKFESETQAHTIHSDSVEEFTAGEIAAISEVTGSTSQARSVTSTTEPTSGGQDAVKADLQPTEANADR